MAAGGGWAQLRQQIRTLESQTEALFHTYSQYAATANLPPKPSEEEQRNESEIEELLEKRESLIGQLSRLLDSESALSTSTLKQNNLSRHREVLSEHRQELRRLKSSISEARDRQHLLANVRSDIDAFRSSNPAEAEAEYMLQERGRIDQSHSVIDGVLAQAYAINENFGIQRETLASVNRRITSAAAQIPGVNGLISRIGTKRRRDGIILGSFIAFCCLVLLYFS
ncbi:protein transport protein gos1 [Elasticomyces elasticus]|uniref:Golgi SNAP receptor complex member 1 n=1 Tax=Exophiala sideris TaxID=1016849 RepID=A0ABR0J693_9EURO|nr:protein transport protein gos1 [Elasticomyces elasticus]KAK5028249.1 protein transport protein gos1 [Exophiala sideris]KAK5036108.1 protein transport protein gos1 [Exophiala sideris]KAK5057145.1 protein transport protein gos1 [Exophiala sideris]KAK5181552.1 protein transport protein gos1 [Eurotiomycetes sp. CCFEE 6388]